MISDFESSVSPPGNPGREANRRGTAPRGWLKMGAVAAASAVLGGLAAAWFYRKTLSQLREAEHALPNSESRIIPDESAEDF